MLNSSITWIKANKLATLLILVIGYLLLSSRAPIPLSSSLTTMAGNKYAGPEIMMSETAPTVESTRGFIPPFAQDAPPVDVSPEDRLVITDTSMSLQVTDVPQTITDIENTTTTLGGYMVNSNVHQPEGAATGSITVRVPEDRRQEALEAFAALSVKVVSMSVSGRDITDQYVDIEARISTLVTTKTKFEDILDQATEVQDILQVQQQIINTQSQIDSLRGQQQYLEQNAKLSKIVISLATDEFALPYSPDEAWRPDVIFKTAVRSLVTTVRKAGTALIWTVVYSPIWISLLVIAWWLKRRSQSRPTSPRP